MPDHQVAGLGALGHLPVIYGATGVDPVSQFGDIHRVLIHLEHVNFNQGAFQTIRIVCTPRRYQPRGSLATATAVPLASPTSRPAREIGLVAAVVASLTESSPAVGPLPHLLRIDRCLLAGWVARTRAALAGQVLLSSYTARQRPLELPVDR
jgi:hypothetical protein